MKTKSVLNQAIATACALLLPSALFAQGSLTPPGAPAPLFKTLDQIEPRTDIATLSGNATVEFTITQPGSYYLSRNISTAKNTAINISVAGVTLDLNGFQITRSGGAGGNAIVLGAAAHRATIRNGTILGDFGIGINCTVGSKATSIENVAISACSNTGILAGEGAIISRCRVHDQGGSGIQAGPAAAISHCTLSNTQSGKGILGLPATTIDHCTVTGHTGLTGIEVQSGGIITECVVRGSTATTAALRGETGSTISRCTAYGNDTPAGVAAVQGSTVSHCSARANTSTAATSAGFSIDQGCTVIGCTADGNLSTAATLSGSTGAGIRTGNGTSVFDCTARGNSGDGISVASTCHVRGNTCANNGSGAGDGAGIHATNASNRIEGNSVSGNDRGLDVDVAGNFIVRNTASANTSNYEIFAGNAVGPIVAPPASAAISGPTGGAGVGSTDPSANFSF